ncbi:MAG: HEAT repeat domain-containing protein [Planctomycetota bacterium]
MGLIAISSGLDGPELLAQANACQGPSTLLPPGLSTPRGAPGGPNTPRGGGEDRWEYWWVHNFEPTVQLREHAERFHEASQGQRPFDPVTDALRAEVGKILVGYLEDKSTSVRAAAARALGRIGSADYVEPLSRVLNDSSQDVRISAMLSLGMLENGAGFDRIREVVRSRQVGQDLVAFGHLALGLLGTEQSYKVLESHAAQLLDDSGSSRIASDQNVAVLAPTMIGMGLTRNKAAVPFLQKVFLGDTSLDADIRSAVAGALGKIDDPAVVGILARGLEDRDIEVRRAAALALGEILGPDDVEAQRRLKILSRSDADPQVKSFALIALGKSRGGDSVRSFLESSLKERGQANVRAYAALALGLFGDPASSKLLLATLQKEKDSSLRGALSIALGLLGDSAAIPTLLELSKDGDPAVRGNALLAIGLIGDASVLPKIQPMLTPDLQSEILNHLTLALGLLGDRASLDKLLILMQKSASETAKAAVGFAVGRLGDAPLVKPLVSLAAPGNNDTTRAAAINSLGNLLEARDIPLVSDLSAGINYRTRTLFLANLLDLL